MLTELGYELGSVDGIFGPNTARAVNAFQQQQIGYLNDILGRTENVNTAQRQQLLEERDTLISERHEGVVASGSWQRLGEPLDLEAVAKITVSVLDAQGVESSNLEEASLVDLHVGSTGPEVARLQQVLTELGYEPGSVDGIFGENTADSLNQFQQDQLELVQNKIADIDRSNQPRLHSFLGSLGSALVVEQSSGRTGELTATLLQNPLTAEILNSLESNAVPSVDDMASLIEVLPGSARTTLTDPEALAYFQSFDYESSNGIIPVNNTGVIDADAGDQRQRLLSLIDWMASNDGVGTRVDSVLNEMTPQQWNSVGKTLDHLTRDELEDFVDYLTPSLTSDELAQIFEGASTRSRIAVVQAAKDVGNDELRGQFANMIRQALVDQYIQKGELNDEDKVLMQEVGQLLSIPGSPTWNLISGAVSSLFGSTQNIKEVQYAIDFLDLKAKAKLEFTDPEKTFLKDLYGAFSRGGRLLGRTEAADLAEHYIDVDREIDGEPFFIDSEVYETSQIVKDTTSAMLEHIRDQENSGYPVGTLSTRDLSFRNSEHIRSVMLINGSRDIDSQGYVKSDGLVVVEQGNPRLQQADNRFTITSNTIHTADGAFETTFSVANTYDFETYAEGSKVTELQLGAGSLRIPDGLSEYMDSGLGIAQPFDYEAQWIVRWN